jgi:hypothetical protein
MEIHCHIHQMQPPTNYNREHQLCRQDHPMGIKRRVQPTSDSGLPSKPGKRTGVVSIEHEVPLMTQGNECSRGVLGCEKGSSEDNKTPLNAGCTVKWENELLPTDSMPNTTMYLA